MVKNPASRETQRPGVSITPGQEDPPEGGSGNPPSVLAWNIACVRSLAGYSS